MAVLTDTERFRVLAYWLRSAAIAITGCAKADLRAAVDATDDWIEASQAAYNTALPAAFRTNATVAQKTVIFCYVAMRRASLLRVREDDL
jgi:hypothetical protein